MTRSTRGSKATMLAMALAIALIISSCGGGAVNSNPTEPIGPTITSDPGGSVATSVPATNDSPDSQEAAPSAPNPASIDITLEEGSAASATIGAEGGSFELIDMNGTQYTLTIPEGALFSPVEITMTPIARAEGEAIGDTFLAGVALQPEGLHFLELATIEIAGDMIEESALGFAAESGGQDFHLTPSKPANGSIAISTTHFSEFGVSEEGVAELAAFIEPLAERARNEHDLTLGDNEQALAALARMTESLLEAGEIESFERWNPWTAEVVSLFLRTAEVVDIRGWNENTPGFTDVLSEMQNLLDRWFQQSDGIMQDFADKCIQGEIENIFKVKLIRKVGSWFDSRLDLERDEILEKWSDVEGTCFDLTITWQANVVTTGQEFYSDISVGSEAQTPSFSERTDLEVEYIEGFWEGTCVGTSGTVELAFEILWDSLNLGSEDFAYGGYISSITAYVTVLEPVYIDCSPAGFEITADAQAPFHGGALEQLNQQRLDARGRWEFEIEYDPGGGVIGQFEEGPEKLSWSDGEYKLWQLVSLYQNTPAN